MRIKTAVLAIILFALISNPTSDQVVNAQQATSPATPVVTANARGWLIKSIDTLPFTGGPAFLSPDGKSILTIYSGQICLIAASDNDKRCIDQNSYGLRTDQTSVVWSPDSQYVAFSDDFLRLLVKSYIWVLNTATMELKNVTDDGKPGRFRLEPDKAASNPKIDIAPHWSADGKTLYFLRCEEPCAISQPAVLYRLNMTDVGSEGTVQKIVTLDQPLFLTYNFDVVKDGKSIVYLVSDASPSNPLDGIWQLTLADGKSRHLAVVHQLADVKFSTDEQYVLGYSPIAENQFPTDSQKPAHRIVALANTVVTLIDPTRNGYFPGWGPTGAEYAYLDRSTNPDEAGLYIVAKPGRAGILVYSAPAGSQLGVQTMWRGIQWTSNNTLLLINVRKAQMLLLHLAPQ